MRVDERESVKEVPVATKREIRGLYLTSLAHGPMASVLIIFIQLLVVKQTKYLAAEHSEGENWIEWREKFSDGDLCNGTGTPFPKDAADPYARPDGYSDDCIWFPSDKTVPGLGVQYTNTIVYGTTAVLFLTGLLLLIVGPFSDYGHYRRQLLVGCIFLWIPVFSLMFLVSNPDLYGIALALTVVGTVAFAFGLRSPFASYLPLLINASHELVELRHKLKHAEHGRTSTATGVISIEMSHHPMDRTPVTEEPENVNADSGLPPSTSARSDDSVMKESERIDHPWKGGMLVSGGSPATETSDASVGTGGLLAGHDYFPSDGLDALSVRNEYQKLYEAVAGKTAIGESAFFIGGQFVSLLIQFGLLVWLSDEDDPKDTLGERAAILVSTSWGAIFCYFGIIRLKDREGPPFPPGTLPCGRRLPERLSCREQVYDWCEAIDQDFEASLSTNAPSVVPDDWPYALLACDSDCPGHVNPLL